MASWSQITIQPSDTAVEALRWYWRWQLGDDWTPFLFSAIGDVFFEDAAGAVWWLSTATGSLEQVADTRQRFSALLESDSTDEWFLPGLVEVLRAQGKVLDAGQCYTYAILPIFSQGSFSAENMHPVSAAEHYSTSGHIHERLRDLPDGAHVPVDLTS